MSDVHDPAAYFTLPRWQPLCAIGAHRGSELNAQICITVVGASIVPDRPRVTVQL